MLTWALCGFQQKRAETRYAKLVFLHPVRSVGHILHSAASRARNIDVLYFILRWDRDGFDKKCVGSRYTELVFLHPVRSIYRSHSAFRCFQDVEHQRTFFMLR
jgi:hypothetical protein